MLVLQKGLILPVPMYGGSYFFIQPKCEARILQASQILHINRMLLVIDYMP